MFCIILNEKNEELSRQPIAKRTVPRNGFTRGSDGNFYKVENDPRCISDKELIEKQRAEERRKQEEAENKSKLEAVLSQLPDPACSRKVPKILPPPIFEKDKKTMSYILKSFRPTKKSIFGRDEWTTVVMQKVKMPFAVNIKDMDCLYDIAKLEIQPYRNVVKVWLHNEEGNPDYVILGGFIVDGNPIR